MDRRIAKELLHIRDWLDRVQVIVAGGRQAYDDDVMLQEAGDSLMMKIGEAPIGCRGPMSRRPRASTGPWPSQTETG